MSNVLCLVFALSGASALLFETLWFRGASLSFGNGVWASAIVLASFMAGLGIGNALAARYGPALSRPVRTYALLEVLIGVSGFALVLLLPRFGDVLGPVFRPLAELPWLLNAVRLALALLLLVAPSAAMGATLPLLADALHARDPRFARVLGRLYGWNTLGAVAGSLAGELFLLHWFGVRGAGLVALCANLLAASLALALSRRLDPPARAGQAAAPAAFVPMTAGARCLLGAAFLIGFALLALEVVWFRFLLLFVNGTSLAFALMLAAVLLGIAAGGLLAGLLAGDADRSARRLPVLALLAGALCLATYLFFPLALARVGGGLVWHPGQIAGLALALMLPVSLCSGLLFPTLGAALQARIGSPARSTGLLTLANTAGAALGPLVAAFVLLPGLGMERALFALSFLYPLAAGLAYFAVSARARAPRAVLACAALFAALVLLYPFGAMEAGFLQLPVQRYRVRPETRIVAVREGLTETIQYAETPRFGEPWYQQLITNGISMSGNSFAGRRYMKLYVWWPVALHPDPRKALLISFGVGSTAKALTDTRELEQIDVVDISRDILELSRVVFPDPEENPLHDPRVRVHVEDGRHFLQNTAERYDLITAEPPPPKAAGVVNLYSREHFQLVYDRLRDGGITTYWLPMHVLSDSDARAIIRAFCDVFEDCSLWHGFARDFMLVGSRGGAGPTPLERFRRQWEDPVVAAELRMTGLERPEQLGTLFVADAETLASLTAGVEPVTDDFPKRLDDTATGYDVFASPLVASWHRASEARARFAASPLIRERWPPALRKDTLEWFGAQQLVNDVGTRRRSSQRPAIADLDQLLRETDLVTLPLWLIGSDATEQALARRAREKGVQDPELGRVLALGALAHRRFEDAAEAFGGLPETERSEPGLRVLHAYALCRAGRPDEALQLGPVPPAQPDAAWLWLRGNCAAGAPGR